MIIFSDLHLNERTSEIVFNEVFPGLKNAVLNESDKLLVCLGDFYHLRYKVDVAIQNKAFDYFHDLNRNGVEVILLVGNHDQINEKGDNALTPFSELSNVSVIDMPCIYRKFIWLPYRKDKQILLDYLSTISSGTIFMHHGIQGFEISNSILDINGIDNKQLDKYFMVISGHYHKRQNIRNIFYVGSPYQIDASEANQEKGYMIFTQKHQENFVPIYKTMTWGIKHHVFGVVPQGSCINGVEKGDVVKLKAPKGVDLEKFRKSITVPDGVRCIVEPSINNNFNRLNIASNDSMDYVKSYIDNFAGELNPELLLQVFNELVNG